MKDGVCGSSNALSIFLGTLPKDSDNTTEFTCSHSFGVGMFRGANWDVEAEEFGGFEVHYKSLQPCISPINEDETDHY